MVMERTVEPLRKEFDNSIELFTREADTAETIEKGWKYLTPAVEGEAILSMGRVIEYAEHGFDGIINVIPFGCMPGTIVALLLHQFRQEYGLPFLNVVVEGTKNTGQDIRFDAFIQQATEHMKARRDRSSRK
jgi:predicted nucleotide-binding protein (sugar kinase/HSP70/actin superfamily)